MNYNNDDDGPQPHEQDHYMEYDDDTDGSEDLLEDTDSDGDGSNDSVIVVAVVASPSTPAGQSTAEE